MKVLVLCFMVALWMQLPSGGDAVCCRKHKFEVRAEDGVWHQGSVCGDCSSGTPYCSYQGCNIFGCNCDGGCRTGMCDGHRFAHQMRSLSEDAHDVIRAADLDGDGMMSIKEARALVVREAVPASQVKRSLRGDALVVKQALPANQVKRSLRRKVPHNHLKRSFEAMDINKDNFLSAQEIDSNTQ